MTRKERCKLALAVMEEEKNGITEKLREFGKDVLDEVFRLEKEGETDEAKDFEVFIPIDESYLDFLIPLIGEEEFKSVLLDYREKKTEQRNAYIKRAGSE